MFPARVSVVTYNLWRSIRWPERSEALGTFCRTYEPDVLCVQELAEETRRFLDDALPRHARVHDEFEGWTSEGNIWWRDDLFDLVGHGAEEVGIRGRGELRRMFWARLRPRDRQTTVLISTVHLTDQGTEEELETGRNTRIDETRRLIEAMQRVVGSAEPAILTGDFNDALLPLGPLFAAGFKSCWGMLGQIPPITMPTSVSRFPVTGFATAFVLDWIVANDAARVLAASSPHVYANDIPPSDHWPIHAVYELT